MAVRVLLALVRISLLGSRCSVLDMYTQATRKGKREKKRRIPWVLRHRVDSLYLSAVLANFQNKTAGELLMTNLHGNKYAISDIEQRKGSTS